MQSPDSATVDRHATGFVTLQWLDATGALVELDLTNEEFDRMVAGEAFGRYGRLGARRYRGAAAHARLESQIRDGRRLTNVIRQRMLDLETGEGQDHRDIVADFIEDASAN